MNTVFKDSEIGGIEQFRQGPAKHRLRMHLLTFGESFWAKSIFLSSRRQEEEKFNWILTGWNLDFISSLFLQ